MNQATFTKLSERVLAVILVLMPFHAILTVVLSQAAGHYDALRLWKELLLLLLTPGVVYLAYKTPGLWQRVRSGWLIWSIAAFALLQLALGVVALHKHQVNGYALGYAWVINLRFLLVFAIGFVLAARSNWLRGHWQQLLVWPAALVVVFGLAQRFLLPADFLSHLGYGLSTIAPYETVDQKLQYIRIQSTLRGPNPLGAYLVIPLTALVTLLLRTKRDQRQIAGIVLLSAGLIVLVATYSRSAYLGMAIAALTVTGLAVHGRKAQLRLAYGLAAVLAVAVVALLTLRSNDRFENTFFHTDEHSQSATSSNEQRLQAYSSAVDDVLDEPFGRGPGTAGPASEHNAAPARIAENYYLQVAQEVGWFGLALFLAIIGLVARRLWAQRHDPLAQVLLASLVGISVINLTGHAWTDDTLAVVWWAFAGIATAPAILQATAKNVKYHEKTGQKPQKIYRQAR